MSEFERTPESMRAELAELDSKLLKLNQELAELPDGDYAETGSTEKADEIMAQATEVKRNTYNLLLALNDTETIKQRLQATTAEAFGLYGDEGMPVYAEIVLEDTFGISAEEASDPRTKEIVETLIEERGLMTFESGEESEE